MKFKELLKLLEQGEDLMSPLSGIIGDTAGILNILGVGRRRQIRQQKEMAENAAKINYKYGEMAAENAFERQQVLYNRTYQDQSYANQVAQMDAAGLSPGLMYGKGGAGGGGAGSTTGAPIGATGATGAGSAADPNMQLQALMFATGADERTKERSRSQTTQYASKSTRSGSRQKPRGNPIDNRKEIVASKARDVRRVERFHQYGKPTMGPNGKMATHKKNDDRRQRNRDT